MNSYETLAACIPLFAAFAVGVAFGYAAALREVVIEWNTALQERKQKRAELKKNNIKFNLTIDFAMKYGILDRPILA